MEKILDSQKLWQDFDESSQDFDTNIITSTTSDGVVTTRLYFTGRKLEQGQSRVFATVCQPDTPSKKPAVIIVDDYQKPIDIAVVQDFAKNGFVAMALDYAGKTKQGLCTLYPPQLDYCNNCSGVRHYEFFGNAKQSKLYEYALNTRRAISYLVSTGVKSVSIVTYGRGSRVGLIAMGTDSRLSSGVVCFGNLWEDYPQQNAQQQFDIDDEQQLELQLQQSELEQAWLLGLSPQTYAEQVKVPLYVLTSSNNPHLDVVSTCEMFRRLNGQSKLLVLPHVFSQVPSQYTGGVIKWLKGNCNVNGNVQLSYDEQDSANCTLLVQTTLPSSKLSLWYCEENSHNAKYFHKATLSKAPNGYTAQLQLYSAETTVYAFCMVQDSISYCTPLFVETVNVSNVQVPTPVLYDTQNRNVFVEQSDDGWWNAKFIGQVESGYLGIKGLKAKKFALLSINDNGVRKGENFTVCFDVSCNAPQTLTIFALCNFGTSNDWYTQQVELVGDGKWQKVTLDMSNFRSDSDGKHLDADSNLQLITFDCEKEFLITNVFVV